MVTFNFLIFRATEKDLIDLLTQEEYGILLVYGIITYKI